MEYLSAKEAAALWGIDPSRIGKYARDGRIEGAKIVGRNWLIPSNAEKPTDRRTKAAKEPRKPSAFRFPLYVNLPEDGFVPPLSTEERTLHAAQTAFYGCNFGQARSGFETLAENAESIYIRICALFYMCVLSAVYDTRIPLQQYYGRMLLLLAGDFPYKKETELFLPLFDFCIWRPADIPEKLDGGYAYEYHDSAAYLNSFFSIFRLSAAALEGTADPQYLEPYTMLCRLMERDGYYFEAQKLHIVLFIAYYEVSDREAMRYHIGKAVRIAYEHNLLYTVADVYGYYTDGIEAVLREYPDSFTKQITAASKAIAENFARFNEKYDFTGIYSKLSKSDYRYVFYAVENLANKQIADICGISERTVANRYNDIYNKLGVNGKRELVKEFCLALGRKSR